MGRCREGGVHSQEEDLGGALAASESRGVARSESHEEGEEEDHGRPASPRLREAADPGSDGARCVVDDEEEAASAGRCAAQAADHALEEVAPPAARPASHEEGVQILR